MTGLALPAPSGLRSITGVRLWTPEMARAARHGIIGVGFVIAVLTWLWALHFGSSTDSYAYWSVDIRDPWGAQVGAIGAFMYSPVAALIFAPFHSLPYPVFFVLWTTLLAAVALWLCPPMLWAPGFVLLLGEIHQANIHILLAAAVVLSLTRSAAWWALPVLTKVTPGVGLVWHLARREWRELCVAVAVTGVLVAGSMIYSAGMWLDWAHFLLTNVSVAAGGPSIGLPFLPRLAVAAVIVLCAARSGRRWLVPLAVLMAMPVIWISGLPVFFLASIRLLGGGSAIDTRSRTTNANTVGPMQAGSAFGALRASLSNITARRVQVVTSISTTMAGRRAARAKPILTAVLLAVTALTAALPFIPNANAIVTPRQPDGRIRKGSGALIGDNIYGITVKVKVKSSAPTGVSVGSIVTITSVGDNTKKDAVQFRVTAS